MKFDPILVSIYRTVSIMPVLIQKFEKHFLNINATIPVQIQSALKWGIQVKKPQIDVRRNFEFCQYDCRGVGKTKRDILRLFLGLSIAFDFVDHLMLLDKLEFHDNRSLDCF